MRADRFKALVTIMHIVSVLLDDITKFKPVYKKPWSTCFLFVSFEESENSWDMLGHVFRGLHERENNVQLIHCGPSIKHCLLTVLLLKQIGETLQMSQRIKEDCNFS